MATDFTKPNKREREFWAKYKADLEGSGHFTADEADMVIDYIEEHSDAQPRSST
jgi:hypothetical protein